MGGAPQLKPFASLKDERKAEDRDRQQYADRIRALSDRVWAGVEPLTYPERAIIVDALSRLVAQVTTLTRPRGNPQLIEGALYDRFAVAVDVELLIRERKLSQAAAAGEVAASMGRDDSDAVRRCHAAFREHAAKYVDEFGHLLRGGPIQKLAP